MSYSWACRLPPLTVALALVHTQIRKFSRTLEMLSEPSVQRIGVGQDMHDWWANEVERAKARAAKAGMNK
jgi:hypothetical protein